MQDTTKVWSNPTTDIKLTYPSAWSLKKDKYIDELKFKVGDKDVRVELTGIEMNFPASHWQEVVREINSNNDRSVLRQWEEEFLGVPLVLTRVRDISTSEPEIVITGLLMSRRNMKFMYRLYAPEGVIQEAENQWSQVLMSADSVSGKLPSEQLPEGTEQGNSNVTVNTQNPGKVQVIQPKTEAPKEIKRGSVRLPLDAERGTFIYLPEGWELKDSVLSNGSIQLQLSEGIGDERLAKSNWLKQCGSALDQLSKVTGRVEPEASWTQSGFKGSYLERRGTSGDQELVQWVAYGWSAGYFYSVSWSGSELDLKNDREKLVELRNLLAIAPE